MKNRQQVIEALKQSPGILEYLISQIPAGKLRQNRIPGKWNIHEHACHIVDVQPMITQRFLKFQNDENIVFEPYLPGENVDTSYLERQDLQKSLAEFHTLRKEQIDLFMSFDEKTWHNRAHHPEYELYSAEILLRHLLLHDHTHMYRIEELWLTRDEFLTACI